MQLTSSDIFLLNDEHEMNSIKSTFFVFRKYFGKRFQRIYRSFIFGYWPTWGMVLSIGTSAGYQRIMPFNIVTLNGITQIIFILVPTLKCFGFRYFEYWLQIKLYLTEPCLLKGIELWLRKSPIFKWTTKINVR